jgi:hypothetical protein
MPEKMLVIASDPQWLAATQLLLDSPDSADGESGLIACADDQAAKDALSADVAGTIGVAIIYGYHAGASTPLERATEGYGARELAIELRAIRRRLPILFVAPVRLDLLQRYAAGIDIVEVISEESMDAVRAALARMQKVPAEPQPWAQVDIFIDVESIRVKVMLANGQVLADMPVGSDMASWLMDEQEEFGPEWQLYLHEGNSVREHDDWRRRMRSVGERLHQYLITDPQRTAIENCLERVRTMENIHFRFITDCERFADVPFEALRDRVRDKFVRDMSPLARRIVLRPQQSTVAANAFPDVASVVAGKGGDGVKVLVILSDTKTGILRVAHHTFHNKDSVSFKRILDLKDELENISKAWNGKQGSNLTARTLSTGQDSVSALEDAVGQGPWHIVHYCGHSVRADDGEVFLVLPGNEPMELTGVAIERFAQILRGAKVPLLVLSSCEGASSRSLFRVAQEGVPATIGFRWEVLSKEAQTFSERLHGNLADGKSIGKAYLDAVRALKPDCPAFLSAMLVVQQEAWASANE